MKLAGIDLAWACTRNPTAIAVGTYAGGILDVTHVDASVLPVDGIVERLLNIDGLTGVAVDASLIIPNLTGQRACERELSAHYGKMGASCHSSNLTLYPDAASVALSRKLAAPPGCVSAEIDDVPSLRIACAVSSVVPRTTALASVENVTSCADSLPNRSPSPYFGSDSGAPAKSSS